MFNFTGAAIRRALFLISKNNIMPRNMSFFLTTDQIRNKTKTVTRRAGWKFLNIGDIVNACVKCQGLRKGEKIEKICQIKITNVSREPLCKITQSDCVKEGFPEMNPFEFCDMFIAAHKGVTIFTEITRIEFIYL